MGEGGYILGIPVLVYVMGYCSDTKWNAFSNSPLGLLVIILLVALVGFITGFVGAGGGFMIISVLVHFLRLELKKAIATSLCIIALNSLIGFLGNIENQAIDWLVLGSITICYIIGLVLGVLLSNKIASKSLKPAFGWFSLCVGIFAIIKETSLH